MSSRPDPPDLEGFIEDSFFIDRLPPGSRERLIRYYEPHRSQIECSMEEDYDPETMSWRDWRNSYWSLLPEAPLEEIKMSDEEIRALERAAATDPAALVRLTVVRLRRAEGLVLVWVAVRGDYRVQLGASGASLRAPPTQPNGPPGTIEVVLRGWASGGESLRIPEAHTLGPGVVVDPPTPSEKRAWVLACLDLQGAVFGTTALPKGRDVSGPMILDLASGRLVTGLALSPSVTVSQEPGRNAV